jgi:hypothetical protein
MEPQHRKSQIRVKLRGMVNLVFRFFVHKIQRPQSLSFTRESPRLQVSYSQQSSTINLHSYVFIIGATLPEQQSAWVATLDYRPDFSLLRQCGDVRCRQVDH